MRRSQFVLSRPELCQALGLSHDLRIVGVFDDPGSNRLHVLVEGASLPLLVLHRPGLEDGDWGAAAWAGAAPSPILQWPQPAGPPQPVDADAASDPDVTVESVNAAQRDRVVVHACRVDETVGGDDEPGEPTPASALDRLREAAADAARAGEPPFALIGAVQSAIRRTHGENRDRVRRELLETSERVTALLETFLQHENAPGRG